jgi:serine/threonine-protein kinase
LHAAAGSLPKAVSSIERVLARDIDAPGARERHERWTAQLGRRPRREQAPEGATVVAPSAHRSSFRLLREVARGGAGTVYEAEDDLLGRRLAYKVYHRAEEDREPLRREARRAVQLAGPGIIRVLDADPEGGWLALEWIAGGSLRDRLSRGRIEEVLPLDRWMPELLAALGRVHAAGLVHGDLKPANVLFRELDDPVLSDFGSCLEKGQGGLSGTPGYLSPERLEGKSADPRDDVYAVGRIVEDVLGAREDGGLADPVLAATRDDAERWTQVALRCLGPASDRPADASAILTPAKDARADIAAAG